MSYPPKDMTSLEDQGLTADEVAAIFGVPDILMGFGNDSYDTARRSATRR
jgi:phage portal protein BeeE